MVPSTACDAVLTRLSTVGEPLPDTFAKTNWLAGRVSSAPSIKLNPESKDMKKPFTAGVEGDISTQPARPLIPDPNNSAARNASCPDAGKVNDTGLVIPSA